MRTPSVYMPSVYMLSVTKKIEWHYAQCCYILNVFMPNVVAPSKTFRRGAQKLTFWPSFQL